MKHGIILPALMGTEQRASSRVQTSLRLMALSVFALLLMALGSSTVQAQTYTEQTVHSFSGSSNDGATPYDILITLNGKLYGTTQEGGTNNNGTVFAINPDGTGYQTLYSFTNANGDGAFPYAGLIAVNGKLYGTAAGGGTNNNGTVFAINPDGTGYQTLYSFTNANGDGANPYGGLIAVSGKLYGTTNAGGTNNNGTVFAINPDGTGYQILYSFGTASNDGENPYAGLIADNGKLYGTTINGGTDTDGTVFAINTDGTGYQILHDIGSGSGDGYSCYYSLVALNSTLYGTTYNGGTGGYGTVFAINTDGTGFQTLHGFNSSSGDGGNPDGSLIVVSGTLYGTTYGGGAHGYGTVFAINTDGTGYLTLYSFGGAASDGNDPNGGLIAVSGTFYGTTYRGGAHGDGTVFSLALPPTAINHYVKVIPNTQLNDAAPGVLASASGAPPLTAKLVTNVTHGTLTLNSDGSFTYTPNTGFIGYDSFTYQAVNSVETSNTATVYLTIQPTAPIAITHYVKINRNATLTDAAPGVLGGVNNGGKSPVTAQLIANVTHGTLALKSDGSFGYTPTTGYVGADSFTYQAVNSIGTSNTATCYITVQATVPTAINHYVRVSANTTLTDAAPGVLGGVDNGGSSPMTASLVANVRHGTLTLNSNGGFTYTPTTGFTGDDSFTYQAVNSVGKSNTATVYLTVQ